MRIRIKKDFKVSNIKLIIILSLVLMLIYSYSLTKMPSPYYSDEVGYWGCAAHFAGIDWTSVTSKMAYYGYGYGIFLFPFFLLKDSQLIYEGALILNVFFIEGVFLMLVHLLNKMFSGENELVNILTAFVGCLYSAFIVYSHMAMSETCILFFLMLLVIKVQKYCESSKVIDLGWISLIFCELLAIHLRNIFFVIITVMFILFFMLLKKERVSRFIIIIFLTVAAICIALIGKDYIVKNVFTDIVTDTYNDANDNLSSRLWFISQLFNIDWWKDYFVNVLCKSFYFILSSLFTVVFAVVGLVKEFKNLLKTPFHAYLLILLGGGILYLSLIMFAGEGARIDMLCYARYMECIMPLFCAIGLNYFCRREQSLSEVKIYIITIMVCLLISQMAFSYYNYKDISSAYTNILPFQITGLSWLLKEKPENITQIISIVAVLVYVFMGMIIYVFTKNKWTSVMMIGICWTIFAYISWNSFGLNLNETTDISTMSRVQRMEKINETADYIKELGCSEAYYVFNPQSNAPDFFDMFTLQFDLTSISLVTIESEAVSEISEESIIVINYCSDYYYEAINNHEIIFQNNLFVVVQG